MRKLVLAITLSFLLTGCVSSIHATLDDAYEVALDDANVLQEDVTSSNTEEKSGKYYLTFQTNTGFYEYVIGKDGIIQKKEYTPGHVYSDNVQPVEENKEEKKEEETNTDTISDTDKQKALSVVCDSLDVSEDQATNVEVKKNGNDLEVRFDLGDGIKRVGIVDHSTFEVKSSYTE